MKSKFFYGGRLFIRREIIPIRKFVAFDVHNNISTYIAIQLKSYEFPYRNFISIFTEHHTTQIKLARPAAKSTQYDARHTQSAGNDTQTTQ